MIANHIPFAKNGHQIINLRCAMPFMIFKIANTFSGTADAFKHNETSKDYRLFGKKILYLQIPFVERQMRNIRKLPISEFLEIFQK